jgi:hypothetical protein
MNAIKLSHKVKSRKGNFNRLKYRASTTRRFWHSQEGISIVKAYLAWKQTENLKILTHGRAWTVAVKVQYYLRHIRDMQ